MYDEFDPVDRAMSSLRSEQGTNPTRTGRTGGHHKLELEEKLMQEFHNHMRPSGFRRYRSVAVALAALFIGGGVFAATAGSETVRRFFVTLHLVGSDGETDMNIVLEKLGPDDEPVTIDLGDANGDLGVLVLQETTLDGDEGTSAVVRLSLNGAGIEGLAGGDDAETGDEQTMISIRMDVREIDGEAMSLGENGDQELTLRKLATIDSGGRTASALAEAKLQSLDSADVRKRLDEAEAVETWTTEDGLVRSLFVLPVESDGVALGGFQIIVVTYGDAGERTVQLAGQVGGIDPATTELAGASWDENQVATLTFVNADGSEAVIENKTADADLDNNRVVQLILSDDDEVRTIRVRKLDGDRE